MDDSIEMFITVRKNSGEDVQLWPGSLDEARVMVRENATAENHMIRLFYDGQCNQRWDRNRYVGENKWSKVDPDEMEILGPIIELRRNTKSK